MRRRILCFATALCLLAPVGVVYGQNDAMQSTAPEKMMPPGEGARMRKCDEMAVQQHIKMEDHARFVRDCVAKAMK
jgi:hypothetical protein